MSAPERLHAQQARLAAHVRDPDREAPPPGIEARRLKVYRDLFFNSLLGLLSGNFPVLRKLLGEPAWRMLVRAFYRDFRAGTPLFPELPREFLQYLRARQEQGLDDPGWWFELAHYEWAELALDLHEGSPDAVPHDPQGDLLAGRPVLSPVAWALAYTWPVHRLSPAFPPGDPPAQASFLLVQRDADLRVRFHELGALTFRLVQRLDDAPGLSGREHLQALAEEAGTAADPDFTARGLALMEQLRARGVILGTHPERQEPHADSR